MTEIFIILACVPLFVINSFCDKLASQSGKTAANIKYNICKFAIGGVVLLPFFLMDTMPRFRLGALACGIACGLMYTANKTLVLKGYKISSVSFMTLCHAAGMLAPCVVGHFAWGEKIDMLSLFGVILTVISIVILKNSEKSAKSIKMESIFIGLCVFLSSGGVMILQKIMGIYFLGQSIAAYNFYSFVTPAVIMALLLPFVSKKDGSAAKTGKKTVAYAAGSAVSLCVISMVMTSLSGRVDSAVLFPLFNGTGIIAVCIGSVFAFKEKLCRKQILAVFMAICGMCLTVIK